MLRKGDLTLGSEHTMQYTEDVLLNSTLETYNLINQCHSNKLNLRRKNHVEAIIILCDMYYD